MVKFTLFPILILSGLGVISSCKDNPSQVRDLTIDEIPDSYIKRTSTPKVFTLKNGSSTSLWLKAGISAWNKNTEFEPQYITGYDNNLDYFLVRFNPKTDEFKFLITTQETSKFSGPYLFHQNAESDGAYNAIALVHTDEPYLSTLFCFDAVTDARLWTKTVGISPRTGFVIKNGKFWAPILEGEATKKYFLAEYDAQTGIELSRTEFEGLIQKVIEYNDKLVLLQLPLKPEFEAGTQPKLYHFDPVRHEVIKEIPWDIPGMDQDFFFGYNGPAGYMGWVHRRFNDHLMYMTFNHYECISLETGKRIWQVYTGATSDVPIIGDKFYSAGNNGFYEINGYSGLIRVIGQSTGNLKDDDDNTFGNFSFRNGLLHIGDYIIGDVGPFFKRINLKTGKIYTERVDYRFDPADEDYFTGFFYKMGPSTYKVLYGYKNTAGTLVIGTYKWELNWPD